LKIAPFILLTAYTFLPALLNAQEQPMEQITVTATRSSNVLLELGSNLSGLDDQQLVLVGQQHINQALVRVPGAWISRGNGQEHLTAIRSPVLTGAGGCGAFFMAQDGISLRAPGFCNTNQLFDANTEQAQRIEVLKGPASTLYGSNAVHGVINLLTPDAFDTPSSKLSVDVGPNDYVRGAFSVAQGHEQHALLVYGNLTQDGGYKDESGFDQQKLNLIHQYRQADLSIKNVLAMTNLNQETAGFVQGFEAFKDPNLKRQNPNPEAFRDSQSVRAYSQIDYQLSSDSRISVTPYLRWADMQFLQHFLPWQPLEENNQKSVGAQALYEKSSAVVTLLTGVDLDYSEGQLIETQFSDFSPSIPSGAHYDYKVKALVYSPFTQLNWQANEQLRVSAGVRYDKTRYDYQNKLSTGSACSSDVSNCRFSRPEDQIVHYNQWSYQVNGRYKLHPDHRLYAQFSKGYRAPQATELFRLQAGQKVAGLDAETIKSIEIGMRGQSSAGSYDLTVFSMEKDNFIFQDTNRQNISNGETSHKGIELQLAYQWQAYYASANGTFAEHQYANSLTLSRIDIQGNEIDTAPQHMGSLQFGWRQDKGQFVELEWVHQGNYYLNPENTAEYSGHNLLNLRAGLAINAELNMAVRVTNLSDQDYAERGDFGFGNYRYFVGEPRSVYLSLDYRY
jgi:outer membrane receptor protein involved in Fe transport